MRAALLVLSLGLALALAEGGLVLAGEYRPRPRAYPGDRVPASSTAGAGVVHELGWKLERGALRDVSADFDVTYSIGADGWRLGPGEDDPGARAAVFVGDSFTFGTGVADGETFAARIGALPGWRALNRGMPGYGVDQMWRALVLEPERPRLVVASFVLEDLDRSLTAYRERDADTWFAKPTFVLEDGRLVPRGPEHAPGRLARWFERRRLGALWSHLARRLELATGVGGRWRLNRALFAAMRDECRRRGAELVVMFVPPRGRWAPVPMFARAFAELEVPFLDLGTVPVDDPRELFFAQDPHLNPAGHRFVAAALTRFLAAADLLAEGH